jgi:Short C-terminal domain
LDRKLQRNGVLAQAEIIEIDGNRVGSHDQPFPVPVRFKLRVHPEGADPVEVELKQKVPNDRAYHLEPGAWVPVVHDPSDPTKVAVDLAEESAASQTAAQERVGAQQDYMEQIKQMTGQDPNRPASPADVTEALKLAQQMAEQNQGLVEWAKQAGVPGADTPAAGAGASGGSAEDPIERLERLAKLRESGAISDEEFERLKREAIGD